MAARNYVFAVRDSTTSPPGARKTSLTPTWLFLTKTTDYTTTAPQPTITEGQQGQYHYAYDAVANGEAVGQIDAGAALTNPGDRYIDVMMTV